MKYGSLAKRARSYWAVACMQSDPSFLIHLSIAPYRILRRLHNTLDLSRTIKMSTVWSRSLTSGQGAEFSCCIWPHSVRSFSYSLACHPPLPQTYHNISIQQQLEQKLETVKHHLKAGYVFHGYRLVTQTYRWEPERSPMCAPVVWYGTASASAGGLPCQRGPSPWFACYLPEFACGKTSSAVGFPRTSFSRCDSG
jgi:hypothetical protein